MTTRTPLVANAGTAIVIGLGNIGSHLVPHVARMAEVDRLTLIDFDVYGTANGRSQAIGVADVGRGKTEVQADVVCAGSVRSWWSTSIRSRWKTRHSGVCAPTSFWPASTREALGSM